MPHGDVATRKGFQAALARGLVNDDEEQDKLMHDACVFEMPHRLRYLFAQLLVYTTIIKPELLWDKYIDSMSEDYVRQGIIIVTPRHNIAEII
jgi:hypothetical protein